VLGFIPMAVAAVSSATKAARRLVKQGFERDAVRRHIHKLIERHEDSWNFQRKPDTFANTCLLDLLPQPTAMHITHDGVTTLA